MAMSTAEPGKTPVGWYPDAGGGQHYWDGRRWDDRAMLPKRAGWYPDGVNGQRYFDGTIWTEQRAPLKQSNPAAVTSLVLALVAVGLAFISGVAGILLAGALLVLALIFGVIGLMRARDQGGFGQWPALIGTIIALVPIAILVISRLH